MDWQYYYVSMFVDRDMFMRFQGGGIGHKVTRDWDKFLQREGRKAPNDSEDEMNSFRMEGKGTWKDVLDEEADEEGTKKGGDNEGSDEKADKKGAKEGDSDDNKESEDDNEEDLLVANEGKELDEYIWEQEGYGTL
ncbi:hypothetical protein F5I97DRAFT_1924654 [Phlebopus sp. FC_14]|nr:hypothetical protein F5I97DRAFT_1924654 [Phlebopus sp. FC_14]